METERGRPSGSARPEPKRTNRAEPKRHTHIKRTWLILHGDVIDEIESETVPNMEVKPGERRKRVLGSATTKEGLDRLRQTWQPRARGVTGRGEAY